MATFNITLTDKTIQKLQLIVDEYNQSKGLSLTVKDWITSYLKDTAISRDFGEANSTILREEDLKMKQAIVVAADAKKAELLADLDK
jgi:Fe-S cluster assembly iron-binding protein IscA